MELFPSYLRIEFGRQRPPRTTCVPPVMFPAVRHAAHTFHGHGDAPVTVRHNGTGAGTARHAMQQHDRCCTEQTASERRRTPLSPRSRIAKSHGRTSGAPSHRVSSTRCLAQAKVGGPRGSRVGTIVPRGTDWAGGNTTATAIGGGGSAQQATGASVTAVGAAAKGHGPPAE